MQTSKNNGQNFESNNYILERLFSFFTGTAMAFILGRKLYFTCDDPFEQRILVAAYATSLFFFILYHFLYSNFLKKTFILTICLLLASGQFFIAVLDFNFIFQITAGLTFVIFIVFLFACNKDKSLLALIGKHRYETLFFLPICGYILGFLIMTEYINPKYKITDYAKKENGQCVLTTQD